MSGTVFVIVEVGRIELPSKEKCVSVSTLRRFSCQAEAQFGCACMRKTKSYAA